MGVNVMKKKIKQDVLRKKVISCILIAGLALSLTACGGKEFGNHEKGVANPDRSQTEFAIMGAQSALSPGYDNNIVLNRFQEDTGIRIEWTIMRESLAEQMNIRIAEEELPDAFPGVGFSNYDISRCGDDGTFIDLTEEYMPNLAKIWMTSTGIRPALRMRYPNRKDYGSKTAGPRMKSGRAIKSI